MRVGDVPVRTFRPEGDGPFPIVVYLHGGGWMMGTLDSYDSLLRALANASGAIVAGVDYRLAPEHRYPAALDDSLAAIRWIAATPASSAGTAPARAGRRQRGRQPRGGGRAAAARRAARAVPGADLSGHRRGVRHAVVPRVRRRATGSARASMQRFWRLYLDGADPADPDASPLRGDLAGVAPAFVLTAEEDVLRDEGETYAEALREAGVPIELIRWPGTIHGFFRWLAVTPAAREAIDAVGARLRNALATRVTLSAAAAILDP